MSPRFLVALLAAVCVLGAQPASAGDLEDAVAAIDNKDYVKARKLVVPLAQKGNRDAHRILGFMYMYEAGVPQDTVKAYMWWSLAAAGGDSKSGEYRDSIAKMLTKEQIAQAKKMAADCKAQKFKGCS
jgi:TPR repeat protein